MKDQEQSKKIWRQRKNLCTEWNVFLEDCSEMDLRKRKGEALSQVNMNLEYSISPFMIFFSLEFLVSEPNFWFSLWYSDVGFITMFGFSMSLNLFLFTNSSLKILDSVFLISSLHSFPPHWLIELEGSRLFIQQYWVVLKVECSKRENKDWGKELEIR